MYIYIYIYIFLISYQGHPDAKGLRNKRFPHFDDLALVFGKDRASGDRAQHATDATEELTRGQTKLLQMKLRHKKMLL